MLIYNMGKWFLYNALSLKKPNRQRLPCYGFCIVIHKFPFSAMLLVDLP